MLTIAGVTFSDTDLWNLKQALAAAAQPGTPAPPVVQPPVTAPAARFVAPLSAAGRASMQTEIPWNTAYGRVYSTGPLNDGNMWLLGFTAGAYSTTGTLATAEWGGGPLMRNYVLMRNRDGAQLASLMNTPYPSVTFMPGTPPRMSGKIQIVPGERYTMAVWNATPGAVGAMTAEMHFS